MLIRGRVGQRVIFDFLLADRSVRLEDDESGRFLSFDFVGDRHDAGLWDRRMPFQHFLYLARVDVLAAAYKHVIHAAQKEIEALSIAAENVTGHIIPVWCP